MKEKDSCDGEKASERGKLGNEAVIEKKTKKNKEIRNDCEAEDGGKKKKKGERCTGGDEIGRSKSSKVVALRENGKRKRDYIDLEAVEETYNVNKEMKKKSKKKRRIKDFEAEEGNKDSTKYATMQSKKKKKKQNQDSEAEESNKDFVKDSKKEIKKTKKQSEGSEIEEGNKNSEKDAKKKRKKKRIEDLEAEQKNNMESMEDGKKKRKKIQKRSKSDENVTTPSSKSVKRVKFSDQVKVFPSEDEEMEDEEEEEVEAGGGELVRGKRFSKEEDELLKKAILDYIDNNGLGDKGLNMVLKCRSYPEVKDCWKYIAHALPWRPQVSVYLRARLLFDQSKGKWTEKEIEYVKQFVEKHGPKWTILAEALGKHRLRVRDTWRRIKFRKKGKWSREEYQTLFDLVNNDLRLKAFQKKRSKHGMLRDNIHWTAISDQLGTRNQSTCCIKWYDQLTSPMVAKGMWDAVDDYRLLDELVRLDSTCIEDLDWDNLLEHRDGEVCRKRWNQMVVHIGVPGTKTFTEQVEILSNRYCPHLAKEREDFDNRPFDPEK